MYRKLISAALILVIVVIANLILGATVYPRLLPYYWGSEELADKQEYLTKSPTDFNTIFLGSSKTHNQIDVMLFDSLAEQSNLGLRSYNFGVGGLTPPESLHIYENLLTRDSLQIKNCFIELDWIATIRYENLNAVRSFYWLNPENYTSTISAIHHSQMPFARRAWGLFHYSLDFVENQMNIGKVDETIRFSRSRSKRVFSAADSNIVYNGYIPMKDTIRQSEDALLQEVVDAAKYGLDNFESGTNRKASAPYLQRLLDVIALSRQRGVNIYFVVPMQWKIYQYQELIPVIKSLSAYAPVFSMFGSEKFPAVYKRSHFSDPNHLNETGAKLYTSALFEMYQKFNTTDNNGRLTSKTQD